MKINDILFNIFWKISESYKENEQNGKCEWYVNISPRFPKPFVFIWFFLDCIMSVMLNLFQHLTKVKSGQIPK